MALTNPAKSLYYNAEQYYKLKEEQTNNAPKTGLLGQKNNSNFMSTKISSNNEVELNVYCDAYDNEGDTFGLNLYRSSDMNAGIGTATYIKTSGKYTKLKGKKCTYAITYLNDVSKGFYKHICK